MNLLTDVPMHAINQKITNKKASSKSCQIHAFSVADLLEMIGDGNCAYTGQPFTDLQDVTFERVNPQLGYVKGNVVMVKMSANTRKSTLDAFVKAKDFPTAMKIKLMRKALYQLEKQEKLSSLA